MRTLDAGNKQFNIWCMAALCTRPWMSAMPVLSCRWLPTLPDLIESKITETLILNNRQKHSKDTISKPAAYNLFLYSVRLQMYPLDLTLACHRDLPPIQPLMLSAKQGGTGSHFFRVFGMTRPGIEPRPPSFRADTLTTRPLSWSRAYPLDQG